MKKTKYLCIALIILSMACFTGCGKSNTDENHTNNSDMVQEHHNDTAGEDLKDGVTDAVEGAGDVAEDIGNATGDVIENAGDAASDLAHDIGDTANDGSHLENADDTVNSATTQDSAAGNSTAP